MSENTVSVPGRHVVVKIRNKPSDSAKLTSSTSVSDFESVKHLLSDKPLRPPLRPE